MKEVIKITLSLTMVCVAASIILGVVFAKTDNIRKINEEKHTAATIESLLGYGHGKKAPSDLKIFAVYRYVIKSDKGETLLGYLMPLKDKGYVLGEIDLEGKPGKVYQVSADSAKISERATRDAAVIGVLPKGSSAVYAQTLYIANLGDKRLGYVVPGVTQGFKTFVKLMVSLNPQFTVTGLAVTEHEEDPGLGAEIERDYFKNQFVGKTLDILKTLKVVKEPLPEDYLTVLDPAKEKKLGLGPEKVREIKDKHVKDDIYALTGATISSRALTNGVKDAVRKFVYRLDILNDAIKKDNIRIAF